MDLEKVDGTKKPINGAKRQFFPYELTFDCPECGGEHTREFYTPSEYLMYPEWGEEVEVELFCETENTIDPVKTVSVIPTVQLELPASN